MKVTLTYGAQESPVELQVEDCTVDEFKSMVKDLGIDIQGTRARVNGKDAGGNGKIKDGDHVEFAKDSGRKG